MFVLNPLPEQLPADLVTCWSGSRRRRSGTSSIRALSIRRSAPCCRKSASPGRPSRCASPGRIRRCCTTSSGLVRPGDFLVIDRAGDTRHACWGGVVTNAAKVAGVVGAVIDGPATDFSEIRRCDMPLWCRGPSPITTKLLGLEGAFNVPVTVGGQTVSPGDAVLADESGVLVLKREQAEAIARRALDMQEREITLLERIHKGEKLADISGATRMIEDGQQVGRS